MKNHNIIAIIISSIIIGSIAIIFMLRGFSPETARMEQPALADAASMPPMTLDRAGAIAADLYRSLSGSEPFHRLSSEQQAILIAQASRLFAVYLEGGSRADIAGVIARSGGRWLNPPAEGEAYTPKPPDPRDVLAEIHADDASLEQMTDLITGEHEGWPVLSHPDRLGIGAGAGGTSGFIFDEETEHIDPAKVFILVVPAEFANGDEAIVTFTYRWSDRLHVWAHMSREIQRRGRTFHGFVPF